MAQRLPELRAMKGKHRAHRYYGEGVKGSARYMRYLTDYSVVTNKRELKREGKQHRNHKHLIWSNCVANVGSGVLLLEISRSKHDRKKAVVQQLIEDSAKPRERWTRRPAGTAVLDTHKDHNHWHYSNFLGYTFRPVGSSRGAKPNQKQSFCLEDVAKLRKGAGRPLWRVCPDPDAETGEMGITPGWGDVYWAGVQEQYIEVKDLPPGDYWLEMVIDPFKRLKVSSRRHDRTRVRVTLE
jgi:lysyl oxidase